MASVRDIAERKEAEEAIRESEGRLAVAGDRERIARALTDRAIGSLRGGRSTPNGGCPSHSAVHALTCRGCPADTLPEAEKEAIWTSRQRR